MTFTFILGIGIMLFSIVALKSCKHIEKLKKSPALVQECQESEVQTSAEDNDNLCYEVTFEIWTSNGAIYRSVEDNQIYNVGELVEVFYDSKSDNVILPKNVLPTGSAGFYTLIGYGALLSVAAMLCMLGKHTGLLTFFVYFIFLATLFVGIFDAFITPGRREKAMDNCRKVEGNVVDVKKRGGVSKVPSFKPTYAFYQDGEAVRIKSTISFSNAKSCTIGKKVTIVINDITGEKYCLEDMKETKKVGYGAIVCGLILCAFLIYGDFFNPFDN